MTRLVRPFLIASSLAMLGIGLSVAVLHASHGPLDVDLIEVRVYQHVLQDDDMLFFARAQLVPTASSATAFSDSFTVTVDASEDFQDPVVLTNRVLETSETDFDVEADGTTDITAFCDLAVDDQTLDCVGTGLSAASHSIVVTYRSGWDAYGSGNAFFQVLDTGSLVKQQASPNVGYFLTAVYFTAAQVTTEGLTWEDSNITARMLANPALWADADSDTAGITWNTSADASSTVTLLTNGTRAMLRNLEVADPDVSTGGYVTANGITDAGAIVAQDAFSQILQAIPEAFLTGVFNPFDAPSATPPSVIDDVDASSSAVTWWTGIGNQFGGISGHVVGTALAILFSAVAAFFCLTKFPEGGGMLAFLATWLIFGFGWGINAVPAQLFWLGTALISAFGVIRFFMHALRET